MSVGDVLDLDGGDVLTAADDDLLDPPGDVQEAVVVDVAQVAGAEPAVGGERLFGEVVASPVSWSDGDAPQLDFTILSGRLCVASHVDDTEVDDRRNDACGHGFEIEHRTAHGGTHRCGLGHPVTR